MISSNLEQIIEKLKKQGHMNFNEFASEEEIVQFEKENNIKLPYEYREWLKFSDGAELFLPAGVQIYGVCHQPIIDIDEDDRPSEEYIVIGSLSFGDPIIYKKGEEKIAIYNHGKGVIEDDEIYSSFYEFLNDLYGLLGIEGK